MIYKAYLKQNGEGCDYTIGCGQTVVTIDAKDKNEAEQKLLDEIKENYNGDYSLDKCELYECLNVFTVDVNEIFKYEL